MKPQIIKFLTQTSDLILSPITKNPIFFVCQFVLICFPTITTGFVSGLNYKGVFMEISPYLHIYLFNAFLFSLILLGLSRIICQGIVKTILYTFSLIMMIFDSFVGIFYQTRISPIIIRLIRETNSEEISGFISTLNSPYFFYFCISIILICLSIYIIERKCNKTILEKISNKLIATTRIIGKDTCLVIKHLAAITIIIICLYNIKRDSAITLAYINSDNINEIAHKRTLYGFESSQTEHTVFGHLIYSLYCDYIIRNDINLLEDTLQQPFISSCSYKSSNIILIVGESFSKHHSNLYKYQHATNPNLTNELNKHNLYVYKDVITPFCSTSYVMRDIFTFNNQDSDNYWAETPLFAKFFKENKYHTSFFSNQEVGNQDKNIWDTANHFLVAEQTIKYCYSTTNKLKHKWDMDLINEYKDRYEHIPMPHLAIFHLNGQHLGYSDKYPTNEIIFTADDYHYRTDLTQTQREMIAHYDNATVYNDKVIANIIELYRDKDAIIIYLSDHGEEIHDYRNFIGRTPTANLTPEICKYQFEIPFMIWMSDKYKATHPEVVKQIESSLYKPFMIDDLPHLMLDIAGIDCEWFDPTRSLINERYNSNRKRLVSESKIDYDYMIKQLNK